MGSTKEEREASEMNNRERQNEREKKSGQSTDREKGRVVTKTEEIVERDGKSKVFDE